MEVFTHGTLSRPRLVPGFVCHQQTRTARISKELEKRSDLDRMEDKIKTVL